MATAILDATLAAFGLRSWDDQPGASGSGRIAKDAAGWTLWQPIATMVEVRRGDTIRRRVRPGLEAILELGCER